MKEYRDRHGVVWRHPVSIKRARESDRRWAFAGASRPTTRVGRQERKADVFREFADDIEHALENVDNEQERDRLTARVRDLRDRAAEAEREVHSMRTIEEITKAAEREFARLRREMDNVREEDDEQFPPAFQLKRQQKRQAILSSWRTVEVRARTERDEVANALRTEAQRLYESEPVGDAAAESRRVSDQQEVAAIAFAYMGQRTMARNRLLPEVRRLLALGLPDRARVHLEAAKRVGLEAVQLEEAVNAQLDQTVPHRKEAKARIDALSVAVDVSELGIVQARIVHGIGTNDERVRSSTLTKLAMARAGQSAPAGMLGGSGDGAPEPPGNGIA